MSDKYFACYLRVSTNGQSTNGQRVEIEKWLAENSVDASRVRWYEDKESGATLMRPMFERVQQDIRKGEISTVVVYKLDRLSRSLRGGINLLSDWAERGLRVVVVSQQIDFNGVVGKLIAALMLGLAEVELQHIRERQAAGIAAAKLAGKFKGSRAGYRKGDSDRAIELRNMGLTHVEVAKSLGVSTKTVSRYLKREGAV
jgi:DNA invertase Pin-like site-specific DNA recombinase